MQHVEMDSIKTIHVSDHAITSIHLMPCALLGSMLQVGQSQLVTLHNLTPPRNRLVRHSHVLFCLTR
jgi:hypothetical protein